MASLLYGSFHVCQSVMADLSHGPLENHILQPILFCECFVAFEAGINPEKAWNDTHWPEDNCLHQMWVCIFWYWFFKDTWEDSLWRKTIYLLKMWPRDQKKWTFKDSWKGPHRRETICLHWMWKEVWPELTFVNTPKDPHSWEILSLFKMWQEI